MDEQAVTDALRAAGARFAFVHGSRADGVRIRPDSDLDVGAWWGVDMPAPWTVRVPSYVDLAVLDESPLWLAGRIAQHGRLLFDDDPPARVRWQAETRLVYLDDRPALDERRRASIRRLAMRPRRMVDVEHLQRLGDLEGFVAAVAHWLGHADTGA